MVAVATPLAEELLFRACLYRALANRWKVWKAAVVSSVIFAASHLGWSATSDVGPILFFGLACCLL